MRFRSIKIRKTVCLTRIFIISSPDYFGIILFYRYSLIEIQTFIIWTLILQFIRAILDDIFSCSQCYFIISFCLICRYTNFTTVCLNGSRHLIIIIGNGTCIQSSSSFQHLGSPFISSSTICLFIS